AIRSTTAAAGTAATTTRAAATARTATATTRAAAFASAPAAVTSTAATFAPARRSAGRRLGLGDQVRAEALGHHLALVDPAFDADPAGRRAGLEEAVVDVGAKRVQWHTAVRVAFGPRHLGAAEAAGDLDLDALGAGAHRRGQGAFHRAAEGDPV